MEKAQALASAVPAKAAIHLPLVDRGTRDTATRPLFLYFGPGAIWHKTRQHVLWFSIYACVVWALNRWGLAPNVGSGASSLTAVLSMVTGLMVSFRSGSSNERWSEGRKIWANVTQATRTFQRTLVFAVPPKGVIGTSSSTSAQAPTATAVAATGTSVADQRRDPRVDECLSLAVGFSYALKHHLRDEPGLAHPDLLPLLPCSFASSPSFKLFPASPSSSSPSSTSSPPPPLPPRKRTTEAEREKSATNTDTPESLSRRAVPSEHYRKETQGRGGATVVGNIPLAVVGRLHAYLNQFRAEKHDGVEMLDVPAWATCVGTLGQLTDNLTAAERIRDTPIPLALGVHLQQLVVLYLATIPPSLVNNLGIWVIPVTAIATFTFFGVDRISEELSDPFGHEPNDLPLDRFCSDIRREWLELVGEEEDPFEGDEEYAEARRRVDADQGVGVAAGPTASTTKVGLKQE